MHGSCVNEYWSNLCHYCLLRVSVIFCVLVLLSTVLDEGRKGERVCTRWVLLLFHLVHLTTAFAYSKLQDVIRLLHFSWHFCSVAFQLALILLFTPQSKLWMSLNSSQANSEKDYFYPHQLTSRDGQNHIPVYDQV